MAARMKVNLIERTNRRWDDLYPMLPGVRPAKIVGTSGMLGPVHKARDDG